MMLRSVDQACETRERRKSGKWEHVTCDCDPTWQGGLARRLGKAEVPRYLLTLSPTAKQPSSQAAKQRGGGEGTGPDHHCTKWTKDGAECHPNADRDDDDRAARRPHCFVQLSRTAQS